VGNDWAAHALWEKYAAYLLGQGAPVQAAAAYRRALGRPLKELDRLLATWASFGLTCLLLRMSGSSSVLAGSWATPRTLREPVLACAQPVRLCSGAAARAGGA
jgi:hypothetical protein